MARKVLIAFPQDPDVTASTFTAVGHVVPRNSTVILELTDTNGTRTTDTVSPDAATGQWSFAYKSIASGNGSLIAKQVSHPGITHSVTFTVS